MARRGVARLRRGGRVSGTAQDGEEFFDGIRVCDDGADADGAVATGAAANVDVECSAE
jgi:hypothetical protein